MNIIISKKLSTSILFSIMTLFICFMPVYKVEALTAGQAGYINYDGVSFKTAPNYGGSKVLNTLDTGDKITLLSADITASTSSACKTGFYYINYYWESYNQKNYQGYVCGDYVAFSVDTNKYATEFAKFPKSYWEKLTLLKDAHPNWIFTAYEMKKADGSLVDFDTVVAAESIVGKSYIQSTDPIYLSLESGSYDSTNKTYIQKETGGWYAANSSTVAYYLDPRNFLDQVRLFMFEKADRVSSDSYQTTDLSYQQESVLSSMFSNTAFSSYTSTFYNSGVSNNVNPTTIAALSRLEVTAANYTLSPAANGTLGYYNFYNIGAKSVCINPVSCGNDFAYGQGWKTAESAIAGGASFIYNNYVKLGKQVNLYFQKWNVRTDGVYDTYSNQYMTNIMAPVKESEFSYAGYAGANLLNSTIEFIIPVYGNMGDTAKSLPTKVDQTEIDKISDSNNTNNSNNTLAINTIVNGSGYRYGSNSISNINPGTVVSDLSAKIKSMSSSATVKVLSGDSVVNDTLKIGTGNVIQVTNNGVTESLNVIIYGDTSGDGDITVLDLLKVQKHILNSVSLSGAYSTAADVNKDGSVTVLDLLLIQKSIIESTVIGQ